ncbi:MAG: signal peptidase I [Clostridia bacterium]|nr:signal peptidase I [Clostridia bacterium]
MQTQKKKFSILLTSLVIFIAVVAVGIVYAPPLMGLRAYSIETGSMADTIPEGSMVYVRPCVNFEDYSVNDVVTFTDPMTGKSFTHRIIETDSVERSFRTKGDANTEPDLEPTPSSMAVGKVEFSIPLLGYVAAFLKNTVTKIAIAVIYIAWAAIEIELYLTERKKKYD